MGFINKDSDHFFFVEFDTIEKANDEDGKEVMKVKGVASTNDEDSQEEILEPSGFDFSPFLDKGFLNFHHQGSKDPLANIGEPTKAFVKNNQFHIEGFLYPDNPIAKKVYDFANILKKNSKTRKMGFSIEGKALEKDPLNPKRITKSVITGCAITHAPINRNTFMDIVKGEQTDDAPIFNIDDLSEFNKSIDLSDNILTIEDDDATIFVKKGYGVTIDKRKKKIEGKESIEKDLSTTTARPLISESVDSDMKNLTDVPDSKIHKASQLSALIKSHHPNLDDEDVELVKKLVLKLSKKETNMSKIISNDALLKAYESLGLDSDLEENIVKSDQNKEKVLEKEDETLIVKSEDESKPILETKNENEAAKEIEIDIQDIIKGHLDNSFGSITASLEEKFKSLGTILKAQNDVIKAFERRIESMENTPAEGRKSLDRIAGNLQVIEKGFHSNPIAGDSNKDTENVISKASAVGKNKILSFFEKAITEDSKMNTEQILQEAINFELSGELNPETVSYFNEKHKVSIQ